MSTGGKSDSELQETAQVVEGAWGRLMPQMYGTSDDKWEKLNCDFKMEGRYPMFPLINKRETGINLRRIMDMRGLNAKDVQEYLGLGRAQSVYH